MHFAASDEIIRGTGAEHVGGHPVAMKAAIRDRSAVVAAGMIGTLGALLVCSGEFAKQFSPEGGYESPDYRHFLDVPATRLRFGHFLGVLAVPLYIAGYWHVSRVLEPATARETTGDGRTFTGHLVSNEVLLSEQSHVLFFGLGDATAVSRVEVALLSGKTQTIESPAIDSTLEVEWK
jgi:hypothetical protein